MVMGKHVTILGMLAALSVLPNRASAAEEEGRRWYEVYGWCVGLPSCRYQCNPFDGYCETDPECNCDCFR
jgi:hypothetical protein